MMFTPRAYQEIIAEHILRTPRCNVHAEMGLGKTSGTLYALDILRICGNGPALVLAPLRVARDVWTDEVSKWENFHHLKIVPIIGDAKERREAALEPADIHTINYENLPWLTELVGDRWRWETVVADESTRLKSFRLGGKKGKRAKALAKIAFKRIDRFINLTGTPAPNGLIDLWGQCWFIDAGVSLGRTYTAFLNRWFRQIAIGGGAFTKIEPMAHAFDEIVSRIAPYTIALRSADWFDLKAPIEANIEVHLPDKARAAYDRFEDELFAELDDGVVEAFSAGAKATKCLQLASGAIYTNEDRTAWSNVHDAKIEALESIIEEAGGMPVLVAYHFKSDLTRLKKAFPQGRELNQKTSTLRDWNAGKIPVMFIHPASAGHGLNLQDGGNIVAFFSHWWDLEQRQQVIERIGPVRQMQSGYNRPVYIYNIVAKNTIDETAMERHRTKAEVQTLLLKARAKKCRQ